MLSSEVTETFVQVALDAARLHAIAIISGLFVVGMNTAICLAVRESALL